MRLLPALLVCGLAFPLLAAKKILYITHSAGFRHSSIEPSIVTLKAIGARSGVFELTATEDLAAISPTNFSGFDALLFFTSGELPLVEAQRRALIEFVRSGKGFGGVHSATDTLYLWPEYGEMIGGYFDGHPWVQEVAIDVEDPDFPGLERLAPRFRILEEIYQFRAFSRDRVRVLLTLDTSSVNLNAAGVNRTDGDFALAWCRRYGQGRVFYTALGHFDETWQDARFQAMLEGGLRWLVGEVEADALPRGGADAAPPVVAGAAGVASLVGPLDEHAPGSVVAIYGERLTSGSTFAAASTPLPRRLVGTRVELDGRPLPLYFASPGQVNAQLPFSLPAAGTAELKVWSVNRASDPVTIHLAPAAPVLVAGVRSANQLVLYATGLGALKEAIEEGAAAPAQPPLETRERPRVFINQGEAEVSFCGLAPTLVGVYQVNVTLPLGAGPGETDVSLEQNGRRSNRLVIR